MNPILKLVQQVKDAEGITLASVIKKVEDIRVGENENKDTIKRVATALITLKKEVDAIPLTAEVKKLQQAIKDAEKRVDDALNADIKAVKTDIRNTEQRLRQEIEDKIPDIVTITEKVTEVAKELDESEIAKVLKRASEDEFVKKIRDVIEGWEGDDRLDATKLKNLPQLQVLNAGGGSNLSVFKDGNLVNSSTRLNFTGSGVTSVTNTGGTTTVTIGGGGSSSPGGSDREVQFNDAGVFGGSAEVIMPEASDVKLKVTGSAGGGFGYIIQTIENTNSGGRAELSLDTDDGAFAGFITMAGSATTNKARQFDIGTRMAGDMGFWTNNLEQMTLTDAGRLGIGTDNPLTPLDVRGDARVGASSGTATISLLAGSTRSATIAQQGASAASPLVINTNGAIDIQTDAVSRLAISDTGQATFSQDVLVPDEAYDATAWNGSLEVPTKNAIRDKIESLSSGGITRTVVVTSGSVTAGSAASTDYVYFVAGAHTISLPAASGNTNRYTFKNNHSANVTIDTAGAETIDGAASISIAPEEAVDIISNGTNFNII